MDVRWLSKRGVPLVSLCILVLATAACTGSHTAASIPGAHVSPAGQTASSSRTNLILILTDDQRADTLWAMPNVERLLAAHGVTFRNFFVTTSNCCPSRVSILTGQYAHHTGVYKDLPPHGGAPAFHDASSLATWLKAAGYTTSLVGKYLNAYWLLDGGRYIPPGWDDWHAMAGPCCILTRYYNYLTNDNGRLVHHGFARSDYSTDYLASRAIDFIRTAYRPFFLLFAPIAPHVPSIPAPEDRGHFASLSPERAPSVNEADLSDKPWGATHPLLGASRLASIERTRERMLETLLDIDRAVKAIVGAVQSRGELGNTLIAFTSDNGYLLGEHRLVGKVWPYEESIRVPLVIRTPWARWPGRIDSHLSLNIDLASTFAQLAGIEPGLPQDGRSLVPILRGQTVRWRTAFIEEVLPLGGSGTYIAIRTTRYLFVEWATRARELYDLKTDPFELDNLAGSPGTQALQRSLNRELKALFTRPAG